MEHTKRVIKSLEIAANKNKDNFSETMVVGTKSILVITEAFRLMERRAEAAEAEVQRLNTTAQPKCQKCRGTGMVDSGGVQPWGETILIDCDCDTAQPVSDGCKWSFDDDGYWSSACGSSWVFNDGGPIENECNFCQKCGGKVALEPAPGGQD